jgi:hypothetical protein
VNQEVVWSDGSCFVLLSYSKENTQLDDDSLLIQKVFGRWKLYTDGQMGRALFCFPILRRIPSWVMTH